MIVYNQYYIKMSILLWLLLFGIGFLIFKHCQRKKRERALIEQQNQAYRNMNYIPPRQNVIVIQPNTNQWQNYQQPQVDHHQ